MPRGTEIPHATPWSSLESSGPTTMSRSSMSFARWVPGLESRHPPSPTMSDEEMVLWRRLDRPGHEAARLIFHDPFWHLGGTAVFDHEGVPCRVEYLVACSTD